MKCCHPLKTTSILVSDCKGCQSEVSAYFSNTESGRVDEHPYTVDRVIFRLDLTEGHNIPLGAWLQAFGESWRVEKISAGQKMPGCIIRAVLQAVRVYCACPELADLYDQDTSFGCDGLDRPVLVVKDVPACVIRNFGRSEISDDRRRFREQYSIYIPQIYGKDLSWDSWFLIGDDWYQVIECRDTDRLGRMPYAIAEKKCPAWEADNGS